jgi:acetyl-CoA carboxylase beta subunit
MAEMQLANGQLDMVVDRRELKARIALTLKLLLGGGADGAR